MRTFDSGQFQHLIVRLFEQEGFSVQGVDQGGCIDLIATHEGIAFGVQCQHWNALIDLDEVRMFATALQEWNLVNGFVVSVEGFTAEALDYGRSNGIDLMDEPMLMENLEAVAWRSNPAFRTLWADPTKSCPDCGSETILRVALKPEYGGAQIWGCSTFPGCSFKMMI